MVGGYADLGPVGRPGLGAQAYAEFAVRVIGWPKRCRTATHAVPVLRGRSPRPLYITAAGMPDSHGNAELLAVHLVALGGGADLLVPSGVAPGDRWAGLPALAWRCARACP